MIWDCKIFLVTYSVLFGYCIIQEYHTLSPIVWYYSGERSRDGIQQRPPHVSEQLRLRRDTLRTRLDCGESHLHCNRRIENNGCSNTLCKYVIHVYVLKSIVSEVYRLILFYHLFKKTKPSAYLIIYNDLIRSYAYCWNKTNGACSLYYKSTL